MKKLTKITTLVLVFSLILSANVFAYGIEDGDYDSLDVAMFEDWDFYSISSVEPMTVEFDCDTISVYGLCETRQREDGTSVTLTDTVVLHLVDLYGGDYNFALPFTADGTYTTYDCPVRAGRYRVYFTSNDSSILKEEVFVVFSMFDTSLLSVGDTDI